MHQDARLGKTQDARRNAVYSVLFEDGPASPPTGFSILRSSFSSGRSYLQQLDGGQRRLTCLAMPWLDIINQAIHPHHFVPAFPECCTSTHESVLPPSTIISRSRTICRRIFTSSSPAHSRYLSSIIRTPHFPSTLDISPAVPR